MVTDIPFPPSPTSIMATTSIHIASHFTHKVQNCDVQSLVESSKHGAQNQTATCNDYLVAIADMPWPCSRRLDYE